MRPGRRIQVAVFLLALAAYLPGFWWGAPEATAHDRRKAWGVDDEPPLGPLAQLHDMVTPGLAPDANLGYPMLHPYLVLGAYAPYVGYLFATGGLSSPTEAYPYGFRDPVTSLRMLSLLAHLLSVFLAAGVVLAAYEIGRTLWGERDGRLAALAVLLSYPMFYYARTSNVDVPVLFFAAWSLVGLSRMLALGLTPRRMTAFGVLAGCAVATKEPIAALYVGVPALLLVPHGDWSGYRRPGRLLALAAVGFLAAFMAYALGSGMVLDPERWKAHITFASTRTADVALGGVSFMQAYPRTLAGHWDLARETAGRLGDTLTPPGLVLALAGAWVAVRDRTRRAPWLLVTALTYLLVLFLAARAAQLRYVMPAAFVLALFAGHAAAQALSAGRAVVRTIGAGLALTAAGIGAAWAVNLTHAMIRDARYDAGSWIAGVARPGDRVEYFGAFQKNPPLPASVESALAIEYLGSQRAAPRDEATVRRIREGWDTRRPRFIILTPDHTSRPGEPYPHSCPPAVFDALERGDWGYVRALLAETPPLLPFIGRPQLDYGAVNPPVRIYVAASDPALSGAR